MYEIDSNDKASVNRPWLNYYPEAVRDFTAPHTTLSEFLKKNNRQHDKIVVDYYGCTLSLNDIFKKTDATAKSLKAIGVKEGDCISVFLQAVPEFLFVLLAAEKIGAVLLCRDGTPKECDEAIKSAKGSVAFAQDYLSKEEEEIYYANTELKHIILVSPYTYTDKSQIPDYVINSIESRYPNQPACNPNNIRWNEFLALGENYSGSYEAAKDPDRPLYRTYTSGSTGPSKQLIHSAATILGIIAQMMVLTPPMDFTFRSLHTILPPALIAVVGPLMLYRIATNAILILDPFCDIQDLDLEFMRYKPNAWSAIPQLAEVLLKSKRIPKDFPMDYVYQIGGGADPMNNKQLRNIQQFLKDHGCQATFTMCYGQSEAGSVITCAFPGSRFENCASGIPLIGTTIGIFENGTHKELNYGEIGEICKYGPGNMIGYDDPVSTTETLQMHEDGKIWLHTGDFGYLTENGVLYPMSRGLNKRFGGGYLFHIEMENRVVDIPGVDDGFFVIVPDREHEGYFVPYLFLIPKEGITLKDVEPMIYHELEPYQYPVRIILIQKRSYFHFKTNRRELAKKIMEVYDNKNLVHNLLYNKRRLTKMNIRFHS